MKHNGVWSPPRTLIGGHAARASQGVPPKLWRHPHGGKIGDDGVPPRRCDHKRYCQECGKEVCSYKDAHMEKVWCYAHDGLTPWTRPYIVGRELKPQLRHVGPGRGWHRSSQPWYNEESERGHLG